MVELSDIRAKRVVGEYILIPEAGFNLWLVTRPDGKTIPKALQGRWTSIEAFRHEYDSVHAKAANTDGE